MRSTQLEGVLDELEGVLDVLIRRGEERRRKRKKERGRESPFVLQYSKSFPSPNSLSLYRARTNTRPAGWSGAMNENEWKQFRFRRIAFPFNKTTSRPSSSTIWHSKMLFFRRKRGPNTSTLGRWPTHVQSGSNFVILGANVWKRVSEKEWVWEWVDVDVDVRVSGCRCGCESEWCRCGWFQW
jgi:hypothetical protein